MGALTDLYYVLIKTDSSTAKVVFPDYCLLYPISEFKLCFDV